MTRDEVLEIIRQELTIRVEIDHRMNGEPMLEVKLMLGRQEVSSDWIDLDRIVNHNSYK